MSRSYENKIRYKALSVYLLIAVICAAMAVYVYNIGQNIGSQREHIEKYHDLLVLTNQVVFSVSDAQAAANLYMASNQPSHLRSFRGKVDQTEYLIDSLSGVLSRNSTDSTQIVVLKEISGLLRQKGTLVYRLNRQLSSFDPIDSIPENFITPEILREPVLLRDSILITTSVTDTVITVAPKRNFWGRLQDAFSPETQDTTVTLRNYHTDTIRQVYVDSIPLVVPPQLPVNNYMEEVRTKYTSNLSAIERHLSTLLVTDQEISFQIIDLLNRLHQYTISSTLEQISRSEEIIRHNYRLSVLGILVSLFLISVFIILIINDANKGIRSRRKLEEANLTISRLLESRHRLLLSVSHDIKTPLNSIMGYATLWENGGTPEMIDVSSVKSSGDFIYALINNLLEFSALESGNIQPSPSEFPVIGLCSETASMFRPLAQNKAIDFICELPGDEHLTVSADRLRIKQIIVNILSNAIKYTDEGEIRFSCNYSDDMLRFVVRDTGIGMNSSEVDKIYEPYHRAESGPRMADGHGLGMYVVKGLTDLLGGTINIESLPGEGTSIEIVIPARRCDHEIVTGNGKNILVVDDDPLLLKITGQMLTSIGHRITLCNKPVEVSEVLHSSKPDIVITDMEMGKIGGLEVLNLVREFDSSIPVYSMTGRADFTEEVARKMGFDGFIAKPFNLETLKNIVGEVSDSVFPALEDFLGGDTAAVAKIVRLFALSVEKDIIAMKGAFFRRDFTTVQSICHKILPMLVQLQADDCVNIAREIDSMRGEKNPGKESWSKIQTLLSELNKLVITIKEKYGY